MLCDVVNPELSLNIKYYQTQFHNADPFKHVLIKNFFNASFLGQILGEFPTPNTVKLQNEFGSGSKKHAVHNICTLGKAFRKWDSTVKSPEFIALIEKITGIPDLIYDPEYHGAGTHNNLEGQGMDVHIDFNLHRTTNYHRRLNLIIYLNEEWDESWGGSLELHKNPWDADIDYHHTYPPYLNQGILFETNEYSWHGFDQIHLPENKKHLSRKSVTVYYYTKTRPQNEIAPKHGTIYVQKNLPKSILPNQVISQDSYNELKANFKRRNLYLQGLYRRESNLLVKIQGLEHRLAQYERAFKLNLVGHVIQEGKVTGILPNGKVHSTLVTTLRTRKSIERLIISGYLPEFLGKNQIKITLNQTTPQTHSFEYGSFKIEVEAAYGENELIELQIESDNYLSPADKGISGDKQRFAFMLQEICFS